MKYNIIHEQRQFSKVFMKWFKCYYAFLKLHNIMYFWSFTIWNSTWSPFFSLFTSLSLRINISGSLVTTKACEWSKLNSYLIKSVNLVWDIFISNSTSIQRGSPRGRTWITTSSFLLCSSFSKRSDKNLLSAWLYAFIKLFIEWFKLSNNISHLERFLFEFLFEIKTSWQGLF